MRLSGNTKKSVAAIIAIAGIANASSAATWQFRNVADDSGPLGFIGFSDYGLGSDGSVAYANSRDDGKYAVYRWKAGSTQLIAETESGAPGWTLILGGVSANGSGQVAFNGLPVVAPNVTTIGIYRKEQAGGFTTLAEAPANQNTTSYFLGTDINASGTVVYQRRVSGTSRTILTNNGTGERTIYSAADTDSLDLLSINDSGKVAISGRIGTVRGVWRGNGDGTLTSIAGGSQFKTIYATFVDKRGDVTFSVLRNDGSSGIYRGNGGALTTLVDSAGSFPQGVTRASMNNDGDLAFTTEITDTSPAAIYFLANGDPQSAAQKVIGVGDSLFGSTITGLVISPRGLNDSDQIAFTYRLANRASGIGFATVPEPATCLLAAGGIGLAVRRRRRA